MTLSLEQALERSPDAAEISDLDGRIRHVNPAFERLTGYSRAEALGTDAWALLHRGGVPGQAREVFARVSAGEPWVGADTIVTKHGTATEIELTATPIAIGDRVESVLILRRVVRRTAGIDSDPLYHQVFENNRAIKLLVDPSNGAIVDANEAAAVFYGYSVDALRAMRIGDINALPPDELAAALANAEGEVRTHFRFPHRLASGEIRRVEVFSGPISHLGRTLLFSIIHDVTDRERLEEQLRAAQRMEAVGRLAGGISHDFNNLLFVVLSAGRLLARKLPPASPLHVYTEQIELAAKRAAELTRQLLLFARGLELPTTSVDVSALIDETGPLLRGIVGEHVVLDVIPSSVPCVVRIARSHLEQVLVNLAMNARDAMPAGGTLSFATARVAEHVQITVRDTGSGMTGEVAAHAFEPFFSTKAPGSGTGLGLAVAYGIIQKAAGAFALDSAPGRGTTFTISLPRIEAAELEVAPAASPPPAGRGEIILVVEDESLVRAIILRALIENGYAAIGVESAADAERYARTAERIDLLLTDVTMPGPSGPQLARTLRQSRPSLPVLYMSGHAVGALALEPSQILIKPFDEPELLVMVRKALAVA